MILPIAGVAALGAGTYVAVKGVTVQSGEAAGVRWRVRYAGWRYFAEVEIDGEWKRAAVFPLKAKQNAVQLAIASAQAEGFKAPAMSGRQEPQVHLIRGTKV